MSKGNQDYRRDSMNSYTSPARSAHGTPGRHYTHIQFNSPSSVPNQEMNAQSVSSPISTQGILGRHHTPVSYHMSPTMGTSPAINIAQATNSGAAYTTNAYTHDQLAQEPRAFFVDKLGRQYTEAQFKLIMRLQQQQDMSAQSASMETQSGQQYMQYQPQHISQSPSQAPPPATQAKPFTVGEGGRHYTREEVDQLKRDQLREYGRAYFAALSPEHKQRFQQLQPQQRNEEIHRQLLRQRWLKVQLLRQQQLSQQKRQPPPSQEQQQQQQQYAQQPTFQYQQHYTSPITPTANIATPNMLAPNVPDEGIVDNNGKHYAKEKLRSIINSQVQQRKERQIVAETVGHPTQAQVPSPESSGGTLEASLIGGEQPESVSAFHTDRLFGQGTGRKRSLPDDDSAYEDGRRPKTSTISRASDAQRQRNAAEWVLKPKVAAPTAESNSTGGAATGLVRKIIVTKQPKSQDATPQKRPRGRPPKDSNTNGTQAKQVRTIDAPAVAAPAPNRSMSQTPKIIDLTQPEKIQPILYSSHPRTAKVIKLPNELDIGQPAVHQLWLHSPHRNGVSMAEVEFSFSIRDNMVNYLSELESHRRTTVNRVANTSTTPLFTDNTMSTEHANALGLPTGFDMLPIINKVKDPNYDGFATFTGNDDFPGVQLPAQEISDSNAEILVTPFKGFGIPDSSPHPGLRRDGPWTESLAQIQMDDLPDDIQMSEELALFRWGMLEQAKNRERADNWGADSHGMSTWN